MIVTSNQSRLPENLRDASTLVQKQSDRENGSEKAIQWLGEAVEAQRSGDLKLAETLYRKVLQYCPNIAMAYCNLGLVQRSIGKPTAAMSCFKRALEIDPHLKEAWLNLGILLKALGRPSDAMAAFQSAIAIDPLFAETHYNMGLVLSQSGHLIEAIEAYRKAIRIKPDFPQAFNNVGIILQELGRTQEAIDCFTQAVSLDPRNVMAHYNLSILHKFHGNHAAAVACARNALQITPDFADAKVMLIRYLRDLCEWNAMADLLEGDCQQNDSRNMRFSEDTIKSMFPEFASDYTQKILENARKQSAALSIRTEATAAVFRHSSKTWGDFGDRISIGYLSGNFRDHPTSHLIRDMFSWHDRQKFKISCYSYGFNDHSDFRRTIEAGCDRFIDLFNTDSAKAAERIHADRVAILVDLNGYTACSRSDICSYRPAPIQVRYLGEARTSGASFFDYLIGDSIVTPVAHASAYVEKLVFMPHCYQVNSKIEFLALDHGSGRKQFNLPVNSFVFCSFATSYKIDPDLFSCWLRILKKVPQSILWLLKRDDSVEKTLKGIAVMNDLDPNRLVFAVPLPKMEHIQRLALADLCLDTWAVNGAATTSDALWAGVPVVAIKGDHFASRMSASILKAIGLNAMVTTNLDQYETLAVSLAKTPSRLNQIKEKLAINRNQEPLFDTRRFVRNIEDAFVQMWARFASGKAPAQIIVKDGGCSQPITSGFGGNRKELRNEQL